MADEQGTLFPGVVKAPRKPRTKPEGFIIAQRDDETKAEYKLRYGREYNRFFRKADPARFAEYSKRGGAKQRARPGFKERAAAWAKARYNNNKEHCYAVSKAWREKNASRHRENGKVWRDNNLERKYLTDKTWRENNRDRQRENAKRWRAANPSKTRAADKKWAKNNPEAAKAKKIPYRKRARSALGRVTGADIQALMAIQKGRCAVCNVRLAADVTVDHIMPLKLGGTNERRNIQLCCRSCNSKKGAKHPLDHAKERGLLV